MGSVNAYTLNSSPTNTYEPLSIQKVWAPLQTVTLTLASGNHYSDFLNLPLVLLTLELHIESKSESFFFPIYCLLIYFESGYHSSPG